MGASCCSLRGGGKLTYSKTSSSSKAKDVKQRIYGPLRNSYPIENAAFLSFIRDCSSRASYDESNEENRKIPSNLMFITPSYCYCLMTRYSETRERGLLIVDSRARNAYNRAHLRGAICWDEEGAMKEAVNQPEIPRRSVTFSPDAQVYSNRGSIFDHTSLKHRTSRLSTAPSVNTQNYKGIISADLGESVQRFISRFSATSGKLTSLIVYGEEIDPQNDGRLMNFFKIFINSGLQFKRVLILDGGFKSIVPRYEILLNTSSLPFPGPCELIPPKSASVEHDAAIFIASGSTSNLEKFCLNFGICAVLNLSSTNLAPILKLNRDQILKNFSKAGVKYSDFEKFVLNYILGLHQQKSILIYDEEDDYAICICIAYLIKLGYASHRVIDFVCQRKSAKFEIPGGSQDPSLEQEECVSLEKVSKEFRSTRSSSLYTHTELDSVEDAIHPDNLQSMLSLETNRVDEILKNSAYKQLSETEKILGKKVLHLIFSNVLKHPEESKYREIKAYNNRFHSAIGHSNEFLAILKLAGFVYSEETDTYKLHQSALLQRVRDVQDMLSAHERV